jgi:hypothetical protein
MMLEPKRCGSGHIKGIAVVVVVVVAVVVVEGVVVVEE